MGVDFASHVGIFFSFVIGLSIPLILVAFGGMFSERSGIINLALEGIMIIGALVVALMSKAFIGVVDAGFPSQLAMAFCVLLSGIVGALFSLLLGFASIRLKANQTIAGTALNIIAPAIFIVIISAIAKQDAEWIDGIPEWINVKETDLGITQTGFFTKLLFNNLFNMAFFFAIVLIPFAWFLIMKTKFGLRLRSCGEHPEASASLGINVVKYRYAGTLISGFLAGIGGAAYVLVVGTKTLFNNVAGYGFLALAIMIFGNWKPGRIILSALFFSLFKTLSFMTDLIKADIPALAPLFNITGINYLFIMLPYLLTIIVLIFTSKKSQAPKAEGVPFDVSKRS
ncbi:MAG: ABC transporter permease [Bacilli bacterium]|jgi:simple sugar transport system permease protein|nr:ABC transporter permease [Bacilli bacterium]